MAGNKKGRSTVYNLITSDEKLKEVNPENTQLEKDFIEYLTSVDRAKTTLYQYEQALHVVWCWNLEFNGNIPFTDFTKRQITRFQNHALNTWGWSPRRIRMVKSVCRSLENYIMNILDDDCPDYKQIWNKIESPVNEPVREKTVLTHNDIQPLLDKLVEDKKYMKACWLALAMYSGRRKAELAIFKVSYFNKQNLICSGALYRSHEKMKTKGRGQRGKLLNVYILAKPFKPYLDLWLKQREELGIESDWLFPKHKNGEWLDEPMDKTTADSWCKQFSKMTGFNWYPHLLRHFFTSSLAEQGIPDNVIKDIVGWGSVDMVNLYTDLDAEDTFDKYFGEEGIKKVEQKGLADL